MDYVQQQGPDSDNAHRLMLTMRGSSRAALVALRDTPCNRIAVTAWATAHYLDSETIVDYAFQVRCFWQDHPDSAALLKWTTRQRVVFGVWGPPAAPPSLAPEPSRETLREWLKRAAAAYRLATEPTIRPARASRSISRRPKMMDMAVHLLWFIEVQVNGCRPSEVAARAKVDRAAVERATHRVAEALGVPRRRRLPTGRPKQRLSGAR